MPESVPCGRCQVIQDVANGWEGLCLGLQLQSSSTSPEACRSACCDDADCEVWQWGNTRENSGSELGMCYTGRGLECQSERFDNLLVLAGQRISHGTVSETIHLEKGRWCHGVGMKQADVRAVSPIGTYKTEVLQCRDACYQDSACSIWEHSTSDGCWYGYSDECSRSFPEAATMVAGERVARACGPGVQNQESTDYVKVFGIIGFIAFLLFCCGVVVVAVGALTGSADYKKTLSRAQTEDMDRQPSQLPGGRPLIDARSMQAPLQRPPVPL